MTGAVLVSLLVGLVVLIWPTDPLARIGMPGIRRAAPGRVGSGDQGGWLVVLEHAGGRPIARWLRRPTRGVRGTARLGAVEQALTVLDLVAAGLRAGVTAHRALELALAELPTDAMVRQTLERSSTQGGSEPAGWRRLSRATGAPELALVAQAWELSTRFGVPLESAVETVARVLRRSMQVRHRRDAALAGPRATMRLLTALPLAGPLCGWAFGFDPVELYAGGLLQLVVTGVGLLLLGVGWLWCRALIAKASR